TQISSLEDAVFLELGVAGKLGWFAFAAIREDQPQILPRRIAADADLLAEGLRLCWLLDASAVGRVSPPVIQAPDVVAAHPASAELRASVRAAEVDDLGGATLATVEGELLVHDGDRLGPSGRQVGRDVNRLPEPAQVTAGEGARPGVCQLLPLYP